MEALWKWSANQLFACSNSCLSAAREEVPLAGQRELNLGCAQ